jgi:hypothetical protein
MKMKAFIFLFILTTFFITKDCKDISKLTAAKSQKNNDDNKVLNINSDIIIDMMEALDSSKRVLKLICSTSQCYACCNYHINNTYNISTENIRACLNLC